MNAATVFKTIFRIASVLGIIALIWSIITFGPFVRSADSVKKLSDHLYYMEFNGNYQLNSLLKQGGAASNSELAVYIEQVLRGKKINKVFSEEVPLLLNLTFWVLVKTINLKVLQTGI